MSRDREPELGLFEGARAGPPAGAAPTHSADHASEPLASRMRPATIERFMGQEHLLGPGKPLRSMVERGEVSSMILWGPPGSGKTTLAHLLAKSMNAAFVPFSAVTEGIARVREIIAEAGERLAATGRRTILFCDEIHRFNKAQQDAFLPHVEDGTVILIGATTENPSFEVVRPLLSRAPVFVLEPLSTDEIVGIIEDAVTDPAGLDDSVSVTEEAVRLLAEHTDGDARRALGVLEYAQGLVGDGGTIERTTVEDVIQHRIPAYDKSGEEHYNLISALHKAVRGSDPDGALYWLARMAEAGEDRLYLARRLIRMAIEDIGLADPEALRIAVAGRDAFRFLGSPEGDLALAEVAVYLAAAPKSNRVYTAWAGALEAARESPAAAVPLHLRNAPTDLMKELGYGVRYRYDHGEPGGVADQRYLPDVVGEARFYRPSDAGREREIAETLRNVAKRRAESGGAKEEEEG